VRTPTHYNYATSESSRTIVVTTKHVIHTAVRRKNDKSYPYSGYGYSFPVNILRTVEGFSGNTVGIDSRCHIFIKVDAKPENTRPLVFVMESIQGYNLEQIR
jgi:hypothetical protein